MSKSHQLTTIEAARAFMFGGNARFTLVSKRTGVRFTYRMRSYEGREGVLKHVSVLSGPDLWQTLGVVVNEMTYSHATRKSRIKPDAPSAVAFQWLLHVVNRKAGDLPEGLEFWHEGKCAACGRALTVPSSIASGFGPQCAEARRAKAA